MPALTQSRAWRPAGQSLKRRWLRLSASGAEPGPTEARRSAGEGPNAPLAEVCGVRRGVWTDESAAARLGLTLSSGVIYTSARPLQGRDTGRSRGTVGERRAAARVDAALAVDVSDQGAHDTLAPAVTLNVSRTGAYCLVEREIAPFTKLALRLRAPVDGEGRPPIEINCVGVVVRHDLVEGEDGAQEHCIAVFFERISPVAREAIDTFVKQRWAS